MSLEDTAVVREHPTAAWDVAWRRSLDFGPIMPRHQKRTGGATIPRKLANPCLVLLMMIMVVSCSSPGPPAPTETVRELSRSRIALPESIAASSLASASAELLVGGRASASGDHPVLFAVDTSGSTRSVRTQSRYLSTGF
jgi:hypothetical protein